MQPVVDHAAETRSLVPASPVHRAGHLDLLGIASAREAVSAEPAGTAEPRLEANRQ
jgi:hypothetical protein